MPTDSQTTAPKPTEPTLAPFVWAIWEAFLDCGTLDGGDLHDLLDKHGLIYPKAATAEEADRADCDEGDTIYFLAPEAKAAMGRQ